MPGIPPDCDHLAEKLALLHLRLFPQPFSNHATECSGAVGDGNQRMSLQKCANSSDCRPISAYATRHAYPSQSIPCCYRCLAVNSVLRLEPYLVVKLSSDVVTEHCCQICVLSMIRCFAAPTASCVLACVVSDCAIRKLLVVPCVLTLRQANMGYEKYSLHLIFTFYLNRDTSVLQLFPVVFQ